MSTILHLSDFHFGRDWNLEEKRLQELASCLNEKGVTINYVIFSGDMIDAPTIQNACVKKLKRAYPDVFKELKPKSSSDVVLAAIRKAGAVYIKEYDETITADSIKNMKRAGNIFNDFLKNIGVSSINTIICCGNHDRLRLAGEAAFSCDPTKVSENDPIDEEKYNASFAAFSELCSIVNNRIKYHTAVYSREGINFVLANTNWRSPTQDESNNMCLHCTRLAETVKKLKVRDRNQNILVAHKPFDDICENVKLSYPGNTHLSALKESIEQRVSAFFCGDKHSRDVKVENKLRTIMCGKPLSSDGVHYALVDYTVSDGIRSTSYFRYVCSEWRIIPVSECISDLYAHSQKYLRTFAFTLLLGTELKEDNVIPETWDDAIEKTNTAIRDGRLANISKLFSSICEINGEKENVEFDSNSIFDTCIELIKQSPTQAIGIKGQPGVGKSAFMTIVYQILLSLFYEGKTSFLPFYFDVNTDNKQDTNEQTTNNSVNNYIQRRVDSFTTFLDKCIEDRETYGLPICLFIDGLEKSNSLTAESNTVEKQIYLELFKRLSDDDRYVMCLNTHDAYGFDESFSEKNSFNYVVFINKARIFPYKLRETKLDDFLFAYLSLRNKPSSISDIQQLKDKLILFRRPSIDLAFFYYFEDYIFSINPKSEIWDVLKGHMTEIKKLTDRKFSIIRVESAKNAANLLFSQRKRYFEMLDLEKTKDLKISEYFTIIDNPIIENYLLARYYKDQLAHYSNTTERIPNESILRSFIPHEIAIMIRLHLDEDKDFSFNVLQRFIDKHKDELKEASFLYSSVVYFCGHFRIDENAHALIKKITEVEQPREVTCITESLNSFDYYKKRSFDLAKVVCKQIDYSADVIVRDLISDEAYRKFNRSYQLHYYQDSSNKATKTQDALDLLPLKPGFDFRDSFLLLVSKVETALQGKKPYPLLEYDLFCLCDLVYSRLQLLPEHGKSLFYSAKYNDKNDSVCEGILSRTTNLLTRYFEKNNPGGRRSHMDIIWAYFSLMNNRLKEVCEKVSRNKGKDVDEIYVSPAADLEQILKLNMQGRAIWGIPPMVGETPDGNSVPTGEVFESLMQSTMESVYIALLFLPEHYPEVGYEAYDKSVVITQLLLLELGKSKSNGHSSSMTPNEFARQQREEEAELARIFALGALDGYAFEPLYFSLVDNTQRPKLKEDINIKVCLEIKNIQQEYKYYKLYERLGTDEKHRHDIEENFTLPNTPICKRIHDFLIEQNPEFKNIRK